MTTWYLDEARWVKRVWPVIGCFILGAAIFATTLSYQPGFVPQLIAAALFAAADAVAGAATWHVARHMVSYPATWKGRAVFYALFVLIAALGTCAAWWASR